MVIFFSFGQSCIFLIGGPTKETEPIPLFLHSGDICLMTGPARLSYHAVPRILPGDSRHLRLCFYGDKEMQESDIRNCDVTSKTEENSVIQKIEKMDADEQEEDPYSERTYQKPPKINIVQSDFGKLCENENLIATPTLKGNNCTVNELQELMNLVVSDMNWKPFQAYLNVSRVNVNVRQVLKSGLSLGMSPETITSCQRHCEKT